MDQGTSADPMGSTNLPPIEMIIPEHTVEKGVAKTPFTIVDEGV